MILLKKHWIFLHIAENTSNFRSWDKLGDITITLTTTLKQQSIVAYLTDTLPKIDQDLADLQSEIDYLKEFKQRLISDALTGKICVAEPQKGEPQ